MNRVFADTSFWIAIFDPRDQSHSSAIKARSSLNGSEIVTTDEVLIEFLNYFSSCGQTLRRSAARFVRKIMDTTHIFVYPQTRETYLEGLKFYESREDKEYSLTDCVSMAVMKRERITDVLTADRHFDQESFSRLLN